MASNPWTNEEMAYLKANLDKHPTELQEGIHRSANAIRIMKEKLIFQPKESTCKRCKKKFTKERRGQSACPKCRQIIEQERRIKKQVAKVNETYEEENQIIARLHSKQYVCTKCGETKNGSEFHYLRATKSLRKVCKACAAEESKQARKKRISEGRDW